jgi:ABC-type nitrate/sulfonate/bicarbonate transport system ATPase subunit
MAGADVALSARGVRMEYRDRSSDTRLVAIEAMDLDIADGEFVSLLGPSGCGKSTFLKIVNGLLLATAGEIRLRRNAKGREDAMVFQDAALFPWYSVLDNVAYGLVCAGVPNAEARKRAAPLVELVGLAGFETKYPYQLSGGMQQRANLARALAVNASILLMDEPFASLDAQTREIMQAELLRAEPPTTGNERWDVFLAALAEHLAARDGRGVGTWAARRRLDVFWFPFNTPAARVDAFVHAPASFRSRGIFVAPQELAVA